MPLIGIGLGIDLATGGNTSLVPGPTSNPPAPPGYTALAVHFDGVNDLMTFTGALSGVVDTKVGIMSFWAKNLDAGAGVFHFRQPSFFAQNSAGNGQLFGDQAGTKMNIFNDQPFLLADGWRHFLASWDLGNNVQHMFVDDLDAESLIDAFLDSTLDYDRNVKQEFHVQDTFSVPGRQFDYADFYINTDEFVDLSVEANRRKFIDASIKPVDLGSDGSTPTGNQPAIFMQGDAAAWNAGTANKGYSSAFTVVGALTDAADSPSD